MKKLFAAFLVVSAIGCATSRQAAPAAMPRLISVSLFPYIPDAANDNFKSLIAGLTSRFQAQHPDIQLAITMWDDPYDSTEWPRLFSGTGPNAVEVDTLTLGDLVAAGYLAPVNWDEPVFGFARTASRIGGTQYAIPTWVCMTFTYGKTAGSGTVSGAWSGSWMLPAYYLVAYTDLKGYVPLDDVMKQPPDPSVVSAMGKTMVLCTVDNKNDCLNGTFANGAAGLPQQQYVEGKYAYTTGFSESSFYILAKGGSEPAYIEPMIVASGGENRPLAFTDGLAVNNASCKAQCVEDVKTFGKFLNSPETRLYICFSEDAVPGTPPRRLSPASASFWQQTRVRQDAMYQHFQKAFAAAPGFPNQGFPGARKALQKQICTMLKPTIPDACAQ